MNRLHFIFCCCILFSFSVSGQQVKKLIDSTVEANRTDAYAGQLEKYLQHYLVEEYEARAAKAWHRDYSSPDALVRSVEANRLRWKQVLNPPGLRKTGELVRKPYEMNGTKGEWIELPLGMVTAQAWLAYPEGASASKPCPLVVVQHGIGSTPETPFTPNHKYHEYGKELLKAGFAVLVPMNLRSIERRNHIERLARLANTTLPGIELVRVQNLLDVVLADPRVDPDRVGMWGVSLGGMATMFWMPLEPRIKAGVVSAWFNHRRNKMAIDDKRYFGFLVGNEEHAFFNGWLSEFADDDVVSLICPRPLMVQHGKKDNIAYWPQVVEEYERATVHYKKLKIPERIQLNLHEGGHEAIIESGVGFMKKWLQPGAPAAKK